MSRSARPGPLVLAAVVLAYAGWATWFLGALDGVRAINAAVLVSVAAYVIGGLLVWTQRPDQGFGPLLLGIGVLIAIPSLQTTRVPLLWTVGTAFDSVFAFALAYMVLRFPRERLLARVDRVVLAGVGAMAIVVAVAFTTLIHPQVADCDGCPRGMNLILLADRPDLAAELIEPIFWAIALSALAVGVRALWKLRSASSPARRILWPVVLPGAAWYLMHAVTRVIRLEVTEGFPDYDGVVATSTALLCLIPFGVMAGLLRGRARRSRVGDLVIELNHLPTTERVRDAIVRTLGDPSAEVGFWLRESGRYVTAEGDRLELPAPGGPRETTYVEGRGEPLAAIVHDAALRDEPALIDAVGAAARFAVENERLHAETLSRLEEVRESRARIVRAGDEERRRIERNLHDGAQQRLIAVALQLGMLADAAGAGPVRDGMTAAAAEVRAALDELRELAQGLHPAILRDEGLAAAVESVAERATVPVAYDVAEGRFGDEVEVAAYFVVSEALANVGKHAPGAQARLTVAQENGSLHVEVADDGPGGARVDDGSGLSGLADRVAAAGGRLTIVSPPGRGTRISACIPCA